MALYLDELQRGGERVYRVACTPGPHGRPAGVIGYGGFMIVAGEGHITSVAVHPDCQGHGVGARLMLELHREARRIDGLEALTLEVRSATPRRSGSTAGSAMCPSAAARTTTGAVLEESERMRW